MNLVTRLAILLVAGLHVVFMVLEMLLWNTPAGRHIFGLTRDAARQTAVLAANQGLYNGFIAAGLLLGLVDPACNRGMIIFLLVCVSVAGVFGAVTAKRSIIWIQALPGLFALALVLHAAG